MPRENADMEQSPLALDILNRLGQYEAASRLEIGGGICLWHYAPYRLTNDVDAWWEEPHEQSQAAIEQVLQGVALDRGLDVSHRVQASDQSWDLKRQGKTIFAFQIARKTRRVEPSVASPWGHLRLESLRENVANKMAALVQRGAPRDMLDIAQVLQRGLLSASECWRLWQDKNPGTSLTEAKSSVLKYVNALEARRPLAQIQDIEEREMAESTRILVRKFAREGAPHEH